MQGDYTLIFSIWQVSEGYNFINAVKSRHEQGGSRFINLYMPGFWVIFLYLSDQNFS